MYLNLIGSETCIKSDEMICKYFNSAPCDLSKSFGQATNLTNDDNKFSKLSSNKSRSRSSFISAKSMRDRMMNLMMYCRFFVVLYNNVSDENVSLSLSGTLLCMAFLMCVCSTFINFLEYKSVVLHLFSHCT